MPAGEPANEERGEHELALGGTIYKLRPSFGAVKAIEAKTQPLMILVQLANRYELTLDQLGAIAAEFIRAGAEPGDTMTRAVNAQRLAEMIYEDGVARVTAVLTVCLADAARGGRTASGEVKAVAES